MFESGWKWKMVLFLPSTVLVIKPLIEKKALVIVQPWNLIGADAKKQVSISLQVLRKNFNLSCL